MKVYRVRGDHIAFLLMLPFLIYIALNSKDIPPSIAISATICYLLWLYTLLYNIKRRVKSEDYFQTSPCSGRYIVILNLPLFHASFG